MAIDEKEIECGCNRIGCIMCKVKIKEKTIGDFNQTIDKIKNFVGDLLTMAQPAREEVKESPAGFFYSSNTHDEVQNPGRAKLEKSLALAHSRIEDLKQQNEMLKRKVANLEKLPGDIRTGKI